MIKKRTSNTKDELISLEINIEGKEKKKLKMRIPRAGIEPATFRLQGYTLQSNAMNQLDHQGIAKPNPMLTLYGFH